MAMPFGFAGGRQPSGVPGRRQSDADARQVRAEQAFFPQLV